MGDQHISGMFSCLKQLNSGNYSGSLKKTLDQLMKQKYSNSEKLKDLVNNQIKYVKSDMKFPRK